MSERALFVADQLVQLLALEFEALKSQDLDRFESLQPGKNDLLAQLAELCPSSEDLQQLPEWEALREKLIAQFYGQPSIAKLLGEQGYLSHQSGKWWEGSYQRGGFTHGMTRGFPNPGGRHGDDGLKIGREGLTPIFDFIDHATTEKKPFFVWYAPFLPHTPHTPPEHLFKKYKAKGIASDHIARYYAMVEWFDETCGQLFARWLDVKFAVFCDMVIDDILNKKAEVTFTPEATAPKLAKTRLDTARELVAALEESARLEQENA